MAAAVALLAAGCGGSGQAARVPPAPSASPRPGSAARLTIIRPAGGEVIRARTVRVKVRLTGASADSPAAVPALPGYLHLYLDGKIISIEPVVGGDSVTEHAIHHVKPGRHMFKVEFVRPNHLPFHRPVIATVTFTIRR